MIRVAATPDAFCFMAAHCALVIIDMQRDFIEPGGFGSALGNNVAPLREIIPAVERLLLLARRHAIQVIHTRESHLPDLSDCPPAKYEHGRPGLRIGDAGPMGRILIRGEKGHDIIPELTPLANEPIIDKPGKGSFCATDLELMLRTRGIDNLVLTGITTDVCVHTTMRDANDRGYECLLLTDCTGATDVGNYEAALKMITMQGGVFGAIAPSSALLDSLAEGSIA